jgi:hypothetical protein
MTPDEFLRAFAYFIMFPAYFYFALIAWNRQQRLVAISYALLSAFFGLLLAGLVLLRYAEPIRPLLYVNTGVVLVLAGAVTWRATMTVVDALCIGCSSFYLIEEELHD